MENGYKFPDGENKEKTEKQDFVELRSLEPNSEPDSSRDNSDGIIDNKHAKPEVIPNQTEEPKKVFKIVCVGDYGGTWSKGVFIRDYVNTGPLNVEDGDYIAVIGVDLKTKKVRQRCKTTGKETNIKILIWEMAEQERDPSARIYYKNASGAIVFWSAKHSNSFENALKWKERIRNTDCDIPIVLLVNNTSRNGTPVRWTGEGMMVESKEAMDEFCIQHGFLAWYEILSRQVGEESVFGKAISQIIDERESSA